MILNIAITLFLVFLNGFFVASEFAIVKIRHSQLELRIRSGSRLAKIASYLVEHLDEALSATQLGITIASLGLGWVGESVVAEIIKPLIFLFGFNLVQETIHSIALPLSFIIITVLHIILGELAPKSVAIRRSEQVVLAISVPLRIFYIIFKPGIWLLNKSAGLFLKLIGFHNDGSERELHSPEEIRFLLGESADKGLLGMSEHELIENVFDFSETPVKQIMLPRGKIQALEISMSRDAIIEKFIEEGYSRMPVYDGIIDNIIGVIYAKDLIYMLNEENLILVDDIIRPAYFVQEGEKINTLLNEMQKRKIHLAIVLDEFGGTAGLVTMEDIIEEIVGEIQDEYDEESPIVEILPDNEFLTDASAPIDDINDFLPIPLPDSDDYETLSGLLSYLLGRIPESDEIIELDSYTCKIIKRSDRKIDKVLLKLTGNDDTEHES